MAELTVFGVVAADETGAGAPEGTRYVEHGEVAALVSDVPDTPQRAAQALRTHWRVLEDVSAVATVLPVRFGTGMADEQAVRDAFLAPAHDGLLRRLREMRGKVQLTVKGFYDEQALMRGVVEGSPRIARLRAQVDGMPEAAGYYKRIELGQLVAAEVERAREDDAELVLGRLAPLAVSARREPASSLDAAVNAAFLVERERIDDFSKAVTDLGRDLGDRIRMRYVGPLPPFSFTGEDATAEAAAWA
jgi:hypothetical protein